VVNATHRPVSLCGRNGGVRSRKYRLMTGLERLNNRLVRFALHRGLAPRAFALLETTGRRSGRPRYTPVGNGLVGDTFWLVAAHGTQADYVRNLQAHSTVRVKVCGRWRRGTAVVLAGERSGSASAKRRGAGMRADYAAARSRTLPYRWDAAIGRLMASEPLTIRIDLDP
jgi:deazaflavin-dependent oxidoreductase (nitroreductase family)